MASDTVGRPMDILMVEDSMSDAGLTAAALEKGNLVHRLTLVRHGDEALDFLYRRGIFSKAPRPDVVLLELGLRKTNGREVLRIIKSDDDLKSIPVVMMSSSHEYEDLLRSQRLNVDAYITKPVDLDKFLVVVKQLKRYWLNDVMLPSLE